jgi:outer membrane protein assembly factor BamB
MLWKAAVPIFNPNSPIVWGNRVFLTGATAGNREVYCFDALSGRLLWQKPVNTPEGSSGEPPTVSEESGSFAAATAATDGRRVYAIFATGDVAAFDFKGNLVWAINLGKPDNSYGHASSLEIYQDRLLVLFDQGTGKDGKSKLLALDTLSGKTVWQSQPRPIPNSWASPILVNTGQRNLIVTCGNPLAIAYDPATGTELWRAQVLYGEITPSPIYANGLVLTAMEGEKLSAIRPDGVGDVTKTHVVWTADEGLPDIPSPLSDDQRIYLATSGGAVTCYDAKTGKKLWDKELEVSFKSSPSLAGNRVYLVADNGLTFVLHAGPEFKELARSDLGEEVLASPAFADGRIYIRGKQHLFCLGNKGKTK